MERQKLTICKVKISGNIRQSELKKNRPFRLGSLLGVCLLGQDSTRSVVSESGSVPESSVDPLEFGVSDFEELTSEGRCQSIDTQIPTYQTLINHP